MMCLKTLVFGGRVLVLASLVMVLTGCGGEQSPQAAGPSGSTGEQAVKASWKLDSPPADVKDVKTVKDEAKEGDTVVMRGVVGGRVEPITPSHGLFIVVDPALPSCADKEDDHCPTPWDYCCEPSDSLTANAATVQLRDADGQAIALQDGDISPLDIVIVHGKVGPRPNEQTLMVLADEIYVEPDKR